MRLNEIEYDDAQPVDGYGPGFFRVGGKLHEGAMLLSGAGLRDWGGYADTGALVALKARVDVVFIGTGAEVAHLPADFRAAMEAEGIAVEAMASPAACRTYNVLLSEGRRVAVAALPV